MSVIPPKKLPADTLPPSDRSLSTRQVKDMFGISASTVDGLTDFKLITVFKTRRKNLYNMQGLLDYLKRGQG